MPELDKPDFDFPYSAVDEIARLRSQRLQRAVPDHPDDRLVVATWNIANLGVHERRPQDYELIAEMMSWFDLVALQEVNDDLVGLRAITDLLPPNWLALFTDRAGNNERLTFVYDRSRVAHSELTGEVHLLPRERARVKLPDVDEPFDDFNRSPFICAFRAGDFPFTLVNVHIYYGAASGKKFDRRRLEVYAIANWAKNRRDEPTLYDPNLMLIGDMNVPEADENDKVFRELLRAGMVSPKELHGTAVGGKTEGLHKDYDQIVMYPRTIQASTPDAGVFDFDTFVFPDLWGAGTAADKKRFYQYVRYYLSDHRILWASFETG